MAENLKRLIQCHIDGLNETLDVMRTIQNVFTIDTAVGKHLDAMNNFVDGTYRTYQNDIPVYGDAELRERIKFKSEMNSIAGTTKSIVMATQYYLFLNDENSINNVKDIPINIYFDSSYIHVEIFTSFIPNGNVDDKIKEILNYIPVGIGYFIVEIDDGNTFTLSSDDSDVEQLNELLGCSDIDYPTVGGKLSEINYQR
jgi:hypothetical protein